MSNREIESLLGEAKIARFCTLNEDGTIHAAPVWFKYESRCLVVTTPVMSRKARNVRRNNSVTVLVDFEGPPAKGVMITGNADTEDLTDGHLAQTALFFSKYMPMEKAQLYTRELFKLTNWVRIRVKPNRMSSFDYAKDEAYHSARSYHD